MKKVYKEVVDGGRLKGRPRQDYITPSAVNLIYILVAKSIHIHRLYTWMTSYVGEMSGTSCH